MTVSAHAEDRRGIVFSKLALDAVCRVFERGDEPEPEYVN